MKYRLVLEFETNSQSVVSDDQLFAVKDVLKALPYIIDNLSQRIERDPMERDMVQEALGGMYAKLDKMGREEVGMAVQMMLIELEDGHYAAHEPFTTEQLSGVADWLEMVLQGL